MISRLALGVTGTLWETQSEARALDRSRIKKSIFIARFLANYGEHGNLKSNCIRMAHSDFKVAVNSPKNLFLVQVADLFSCF